MTKKQRAKLAALLRQYGKLRSAAVSTEAALAVSRADNPGVPKSLAEGNVTPNIADFIPASMPSTRAFLLLDGRHDRGALIASVADVLDEQGSRGAGWSMLYVSVVGAGLVVTLFSVFVAPTFRSMFDSFGAQLPAPTLLALWFAQWVIGPLGILVILLALVKSIWEYRPQLLGKLTHQVDAALLKVPVLSQARKVIFTRRLAIWLGANGMHEEMKRHLDCLAELAGPGQFGRQVNRLAETVQAGESLQAALAAPGWLPGLAILLQDASNASTDSDHELHQKLAAYARSLDDRSDAVSAQLTLFAQLAVGAIIGFFVIAMYLPIFKMGSAI